MAPKAPAKRRPDKKARNRDLSKTLLQDEPGKRHFGRRCQEAQDTNTADAWMRANGHSW